jgi:hypothetical protein
MSAALTSLVNTKADRSLVLPSPVSNSLLTVPIALPADQPQYRTALDTAFDRYNQVESCSDCRIPSESKLGDQLQTPTWEALIDRVNHVRCKWC